jgi:hypothetical protein
MLFKVAGWAGQIISSYGQKVGRITALDAAGPVINTFYKKDMVLIDYFRILQ